MSSSANKQISNTGELSLGELLAKLKECWHYLLQQWKLFVVIGLVGAMAGFGFGFIKKTIYSAKLSFALEDEKGGGMGLAAGLASQFGFDLGGGGGGGAFAGDNLIELMKSRLMIEKTLLTSIDAGNRKQTLAQYYMAVGGYQKKWENKPGLKNIQFVPGADRTKFTLQQDSVLGVFYDDISDKYLSVDKPDKKLNIIAVVVKSDNELFAQKFAEVLVDNVSKFYVETKTKKSQQNVNILKHQTDSVKAELSAAFNGVASSNDAIPNANPSRSILRTPSLRWQVGVQVNQAVLIELVKNFEIAKVTLRKETPLVQIIDTPILPLPKNKPSKLLFAVVGGMLLTFLSIIGAAVNYFLKK